MLFENFSQSASVFGKIFKTHRTVFDKGDRFSITFIDIMIFRPDFRTPNCGLKFRLRVLPRHQETPDLP